MSPYKVDYSELVTALQNHQRGESNVLLTQLLPRLKTYLMVTMEVTPQDAEEAVHQAFLNTYKKIMRDEIREKKSIYKYLLRACRNEYLRLNKKKMYFLADSEIPPEITILPAEQIQNLVDKDRQKILKACLKKLPEESRVYITYILNNPDVSTKSLSERFGISEANARVKKSRIIDDLSHCVKKKWNE